VSDVDLLAREFEAHRNHLRSVAYRMLGSAAEADDAVQESWLRLTRTDSDDIRNLGGWLTTVTARVCLDMLRSRAARREEPLDVHVPDPLVTLDDDPEQQTMLADSVGLALLVVLDALTPAERLAFVLHDLFAVPFDEIGRILDRSPDAAKQLASRARRRVQGAPSPEVDPNRQREVLDAFLAASRSGEFEALVALLDPDVVLRADAGAGPLGPSKLIRGAHAVASQAMHFSHLSQFARRATVNGRPGLVAISGGRLISVLDVTVRDGRIVEMNILADPDRLAEVGRWTGGQG
jgi:RNA polymerase sigma factor (sigma-70 family)